MARATSCPWALTTLLLAACGASDEGASAPLPTAERLVRAMNGADLASYLATFPDQARLAGHFDCPPEHALADALLRTRDEAPQLLDTWRASGLRMRLGRLDLAGAEQLLLTEGDSHRDCLVKAPVEILTVPVSLEVRHSGRSEQTVERWPFWRFPDDPTWYYARF
jgi:hypothetical protein